MQVKTSKKVTDRQKKGRYVLSVFELQGDVIAAEIERRFGSGPAGESVDYRHLFRGLAGALADTLRRLVAADEAHYVAKAEHAEAIRRRDRLVAPIVERLVGLRRIVTGKHRHPDLGRLGLAGETPRDASALLRKLDRVVKVLGRDGYVEMLGEPTFEDHPLDPRGFLPCLEQDATRLRGRLEELNLVRRRVEDALLKKKNLLRDYDQLYVRAARIFEDCCRLAGRGELAERIRRRRK